jgi:hypothetical protein
MAITAQYIEALKKQKKLISELGSSSPIPGLSVEQVAKNLAELDQNLSKTINYYKEQAEKEADKEEQAAANSGVEETPQQKEARRKKKREEAASKGKEIINNYVESQRDFIQEQISIIEVNYGVIGKEVSDLPQTITLATATSLQPAAIGTAVPNPIFNLGLLYQTISGIRRSLGNIKTAFLNMLIAADKIKFALPEPITGLLQKILSIEKTLGSKSPKVDAITAPPPPVPEGTEATLKVGEYRVSSNTQYAIVTAENEEINQVRKGQVGQILEYFRDSKGVITGIKIRVVPAIP